MFFGGILHKGKKQFKPHTSVTGCKVWLRSDLGVTLTGDNVTTWADQSGNGNNYTGTYTQSPIYNSSGGINNLPYLSTSGGGRSLSRSDSPLSSVDNCTIVTVHKFDDPTAENQSNFVAIVDFGATTDGVHVGISYAYQDGVPRRSLSGVTNQQANVAPDGYSTASTDNECWIWRNETYNSSTNLDLRVNGVNHKLIQTRLQLLSGSPSATSKLFTQNLSASLYEIIVYDNKISDADVVSLEAYLQDRYGLISQIVAPAFSPSDLYGLAIWLKSDVGVQLSGSDVTQWDDQSGLGHHVSQTDPNRPTYSATGGPNNAPRIIFNSANTQSLVTSSSGMTSGIRAYTIFMVFKFTSRSSTTSPLYVGSINSFYGYNGFGMYLKESGDDKRGLMFGNGFDSTPNVNLDGTATSNSEIWLARINNSSGGGLAIDGYINSTSVSGFANPNSFFSIGGNFTHTQLNNSDIEVYEIIAYRQSPSSYFPGGYYMSHSDSASTKVVNYLKTKYAL